MDDLSVLGLSLTVADTPVDGSFVPAAVDGEGLVMLSDMQSEQAVTELTQSLIVLLSDMLAPVLM